MKFQNLSEIRNVTVAFDHARSRYQLANDERHCVVSAVMVDKRNNSQLRLGESVLLDKLAETIADHYKGEMQLLREELVQLGVDYESIPMS